MNSQLSVGQVDFELEANSLAKVNIDVALLSASGLRFKSLSTSAL